MFSRRLRRREKFSHQIGRRVGTEHQQSIARFDPVATGALTFERLEDDRYPCFALAMDYGRRGGSWPASLCGADETAVEMFLAGKMSFSHIPKVIGQTLAAHEPVAGFAAQDSSEWSGRAGSTWKDVVYDLYLLMDPVLEVCSTHPDWEYGN